MRLFPHQPFIKTSGLDWMKFDPFAASVRYLLPFVNFGGGREKTDENLSELDSKWKAHLAQGGGRNNMPY
jgi:hypothetical protein